MDFSKLKKDFIAVSENALADGIYQGVIESAITKKSKNGTWMIQYVVVLPSKQKVWKYGSIEHPNKKVVEISLQQLSVLSNKAKFNVDDIDFQNLDYLINLPVTFKVKDGNIGMLY